MSGIQGVSAEQRRAIEWECARLVAQYANLNDAGDWAAAAALFAEDGRMSRPTAPDDFIEGRAAILEAFTSRPARTTRHVTGNVVVDVESATEARGESALLLFLEGKAPIAGGYTDRFVLTGDGWRFAERRGYLTF